MDKHYLRIGNESFGFVLEGIHDIKNNDIPVDESEYKKFFEMQSSGLQFRLKEKRTGNKLFDILETYETKVDIGPHIPNSEERLAALEKVVLGLL